MPANQSGLGGQLTIGKESTYGTVVARTRSMQFRSENVKGRRNFLNSRQISGGEMFQRSSRRDQTTRDASGPLTLEVPTKGFGLFLDQLHGNTVTPVQQAATTAYLQTHNIGLTDPSAKSLSMQIGRPQTSGAVSPFTFQGVKVTAATFRLALNEFLTCELQLDAQDEVTNVALDSYAPAAGLGSFTFMNGVITVDGSPAGRVTEITIPISFAYDLERWGVGSGATKSNPITNDYPTSNPTITVDWASTTLRDNWVNGANSALVLDCTRNTIASTYKEQIKFTMAAVGYNGDDPTVDGPGVLNQQIPFELLYDGTNAPLKIEYQSTDTTL
ncbi:MAG TPA: phage tail tube protein [Solirubrobacter sp.]|nr:phage tail tube protein [Solirubrobacter sp.]